MRVRITRQHVTFDDEGVAEVPIPVSSKNAVHTHLRWERLNDRAIELFFTEFLWDEVDDQEALLGALEFVEDEDDEE